ncbi:MAG TPA: hypothetical protein VM432_00485 [Bdellovibrionales bacterium]|nr:hypothetical protein [Bdellovibrionales bacterium]
MRLSTIHLLVYLFVFVATSLAFEMNAFAESAGSPMIFDVRRSLPLEPNEPVYHDFYINAGPESGFKKGAFVTVVRALPVHDPLQNAHQATLNIRIGRLEIIHTEKNITVGRLYSEFGDDERPTVEFEAVMIGDRIDTSTITMEAPKKKKTAKVEAAPAPQPAPVAATIAIQTTEAASTATAAAPVQPLVAPAPPTQTVESGIKTPAAPPIEVPATGGGSAATPPTVPETLPQSLPSEAPPASV